MGGDGESTVHGVREAYKRKPGRTKVASRRRLESLKVGLIHVFGKC